MVSGAFSSNLGVEKMKKVTRTLLLMSQTYMTHQIDRQDVGQIYMPQKYI